MHLKISSVKWRPFCPRGDELAHLKTFFVMYPGFMTKRPITYSLTESIIWPCINTRFICTLITHLHQAATTATMILLTGLGNSLWNPIRIYTKPQMQPQLDCNFNLITTALTDIIGLKLIYHSRTCWRLQYRVSCDQVETRLWPLHVHRFSSAPRFLQDTGATGSLRSQAN